VEKTLTQLLLGKDLRKLKNVERVIELVRDQKSFDDLFGLSFHHERALVMRAIDAVEKITLKNPEYLRPHKSQLLSVLKSADHKELRWHAAQLISRIQLTPDELQSVWHVLSYWVLNRNESKIVRVNSLQSLFDLSRGIPALEKDFETMVSKIKSERIPSIQARLKKISGNTTTHKNESTL
jgi:hypothetical protein